MNWKEFRLVKEGQFDKVNLGNPSIINIIRRTRRNTAEVIRGLIEEKEVTPEMTVGQLLQILES